MNVFSLDRRIKFFFLRHRSCGLKLPNGRFGRPYENRLSLVKAEAHDDALIIELDHPLHLIFHGIPTLESKTDGLHLTDFNALVFEWKEASGDQRPHRERYISGEVHLVVQRVFPARIRVEVQAFQGSPSLHLGPRRHHHDHGTMAGRSFGRRETPRSGPHGRTA